MQFENLSYESSTIINFKNFSKKSECILPKFGITGNQLKIYLHLITTGSKTASQISKFLAIPRTEAYTLLKILQKKGFIVLKRSRPMLLAAAPFENALNRKIENEKIKIRDLENFLLSLKEHNEIYSF